MTDSGNSGTCLACKFFHKETEEGGQCRKEPPKFVILPGNLQGQKEIRGLFPPTAASSWCGCFERVYDGCKERA